MEKEEERSLSADIFINEDKIRIKGFSGRCLELPGAISQGETLEELKVNITDAIQLMLASIYEEAHEKKRTKTEVSV
jgi:predicted RNase H-like HicB family nuclease